ncbi:Canalicular multispecific organic anion transporter 2 [Babesia sp. Xinjiang]|uniref:Canalicular multispecific organic anion transporter 2 n=1 Tax=Babesia sp. Xinjiang TaxID=462227 RepID=UPI000A232B6B|nr:Canalicular multispecific organic anion transporter 2 [Babesia sp. Xinjiang]ORM41908.1 Canalicular multispecific organic anion transporter 2 [Babesia sp. Xinjiang]
MPAEAETPNMENKEGSRRLRYFDDWDICNYVSMSWVHTWVEYIAEETCDLKSLHPIPKADEISSWQTVFSKHISDGVLKLERSESRGLVSTAYGQNSRWNGSIFLRAIVLTFWKRALLTLLGCCFVSVSSMATAILLKFLFDQLSADSNAKSHSIQKILSIVIAVVLVESFHSVIEQHIQLYVYRLEICIEAVISITLFQHGLVYRRHYASTLSSHSPLHTCKSVVHFNEPSGKSCSRDPLSCPARRHQHRELPPSMYTYMVLDANAITMVVESVIAVVSFLCSFSAGLLFVKAVMGFPILMPTITVLVAVFSMVFLELLNGSLRHYSLESMDARISISSDVLGNLQLSTTMGIDDVVYRAIQNSRDDELAVLRVQLFLRFLTRSIERSVGILLFWVFVYVFNKEVALIEPGETLRFQLGELISIIFIIANIVVSCKHLPKAFRQFVETTTSYHRVETFLQTCSSNYYLESNKDEENMVEPQKLPPNISSDTVVYYKDASFSYISTRNQLLSGDHTSSPPLFQSLNFLLLRRDICVITGNQGSGKTSFIKSILGEMSLVSGSMAVAPLAAGMPIFYSSQEVWLPSGTIRSIITFGHQYDEEVYDTVVSSAELETDFRSWADGDLRHITEKGHCLSGGQRVRIGLARALYAYMIYSKANEKMENRCCFMVCLDEPFEGLDTNVSRAIFKNLFRNVGGILTRDDVAVVLTMSKMSLDMVLTNDACLTLTNMFMRVLDDGMLHEPVMITDGSWESKTKLGDQDRSVIYNSFGRMMSQESSESPAQPATTAGMASNVGQETHTHENEQFAYTWSAYIVYLQAVGPCLFTFFVILLLVSNAAVNLKLLTAAKWVDGMRRLTTPEWLKEIMEHHKLHYFWITVLTFASISCFAVLIFVVVSTSLRASRRIYSFALKRLFHQNYEAYFNTCMGALMTFLTSDIHIIDEMIGNYLYETTFSLVAFLVKFASLCYMVPMAVPVPLATFWLLYYCAHRKVLRSSKILQRLMLEANSNVNAVYSEVMSGSSLYRSFCKEHMWLDLVRERSNEYYRTIFLKAAYTTWATLVTKVSVAVMIAAFILIPVLYSYLAGTELEVAHLGVGMSMCLGFGNSLRWLITNYAHLEKYMCSVARFEKYFLQGGVKQNEKFECMAESVVSGFKTQENDLRTPPEDSPMGNCLSNKRTITEIQRHKSVTVVVNESPNSEQDDSTVLRRLLRRRRAEYRSYAFRRYTSLFGWYCYRPRIDVLDPSPYLSFSPSVLELVNVSVSTPSVGSIPSTGCRLNNVTFRATVGDVIGVMGRTGAGKSTLLGVIQNIVPGREGSVLLDGHDINTIPRRLLRHLVGVLPQLPYIYKGWTLRRFLDPRMLYSDTEIVDAIDCCGLQELVNGIHGVEALDTVLVSDDVRPRHRLFLAPPMVPLAGNVYEHCLCSVMGPDESDERRVLLSTTQQRQLLIARLVLYRRTYRLLLIDEPPWTDNRVEKKRGSACVRRFVVALNLLFVD